MVCVFNINLLCVLVDVGICWLIMFIILFIVLFLKNRVVGLCSILICLVVEVLFVIVWLGLIWEMLFIFKLFWVISICGLLSLWMIGVFVILLWKLDCMLGNFFSVLFSVVVCWWCRVLLDNMFIGVVDFIIDKCIGVVCMLIILIVLCVKIKLVFFVLLDWICVCLCKWVKLDVNMWSV